MQVKNNKQSSDTWAGQAIATGGVYVLDVAEIPKWQNTDKVIQDLSTGDLLVGDGVSYKAAGAQAIAYLLQSKNDVSVEYMPAFAAKTLVVNGVIKKLFKRVHGAHTTVGAGQTVSLDFEVPYNVVKFSGAEIVGVDIGDTLDFTVHDDANNTYSQAPVGQVGANYQLNKFGYAVEMPPGGFYQNTSNYDADLYLGMRIRCTYTNNGSSSKYIGMNVWLHELKD